jgi:hypothetical protein
VPRELRALRRRVAAIREEPAVTLAARRAASAVRMARAARAPEHLARLALAARTVLAQVE